LKRFAFGLFAALVCAGAVLAASQPPGAVRPAVQAQIDAGMAPDPGDDDDDAPTREEEGGFNAGTGARFREQILGVGGSRPALESFVAFRGRKPSMDALLRHNGMTATA